MIKKFLLLALVHISPPGLTLKMQIVNFAIDTFLKQER